MDAACTIAETAAPTVLQSTPVPSSLAAQATVPPDSGLDSSSKADKDITSDEQTLAYFKTGNMPADADRTEKSRIRTKAQRYEYNAGADQLYHKATHLPIPPLDERRDH